jgi:hypothetical protein
VIKPQFRFFDRRFDEKRNNGRAVTEDFEYSSGTNTWRLTVEELRKMLKEL